MTPTDVRTKDGKTQLMFSLPRPYGYESILRMSQFVVDVFLNKTVFSIRTCLLSGLPEQEHRIRLWFHGNRIDKCPSLTRESGMLFLRGRHAPYKESIEFVWFNQTNSLGVLFSEKEKSVSNDIYELVDKMMVLL